MRTFGVRALLALLVATTIGMAQARLPNEPVGAGEEIPLANPVGANIVAIGFETLLAEYYWLRAVQIAGSEEGGHGRSREIGGLINLVTSLDPWVDHPYRFAALWMKDDLDAIRAANRLLERGIEHHPNEWRNRFYLGFNHFFYLGDQARAAEILEGAIDLPNCPAYMGGLVARLKSSEAGLDTAAGFLAAMLKQTQDQVKRNEYERALTEIEIERRARFLDERRAAYVERTGRDIQRVEDLLTLEPPLLLAIPPDPLGEGWSIDASGTIVSSALGRRYRLHIDDTNRKAIQRMAGSADPGTSQGGVEE